MKFKLTFPKARPNRRSMSGSSNSKKHKHDLKTVESWNELRRIGADSKKPHALESVLKDNDDDLILQEAQDWDYYIAQFNEQYRQQLKHTNVVEGEERSISTIADTPSQLLQSRLRRKLVFRKLFILSCLGLWSVCFWGCYEWYLTYMIYPIGFLHDVDNGLVTRYFTPSTSWFAFVLNSHSWMVGCFGLLCAYCFRENPGWLKQFILRVPYFLIIPSFLIFISVRFVGTFSSQKLEKAMEKKIPEYHEYDNLTYAQVQKKAKVKLGIDFSSRRLWDQIQKILQCCGVHGAQDWDSVDDDLTDEISYWPSTCCPKSFVRRTWTKERPQRDDCYYKINKLETMRGGTGDFEWAYPNGCLNEAYEFFVKMGAYFVGIMFANFCGLCICLTFAFKYYVLTMKVEQTKFKYSFKQWLADIFFLTHCKCVVNGCRKVCSKLKRDKKPDIKTQHKSFASGHQSQVSADSAPAIVITEPEPGRQIDEENPPEQEKRNDEEDPGNVNDLHVLFSEPEPDIPPSVFMIDENELLEEGEE